MIAPNPGKGRERLLFPVRTSHSEIHSDRTPTCNCADCEAYNLIDATTPRVLRTTVGGGSDSRGGFEGGDELEYPLHVRLERLERVREELEHDLLRVRLARLIEDHLHDLGLHILGQLFLRVVSAAGGRGVSLPASASPAPPVTAARPQSAEHDSSCVSEYH